MAGYSKNKRTADRQFAEDYINTTNPVNELTTRERIALGHDFTDEEGNYWGHVYNDEGKRVRVCIPND